MGTFSPRATIRNCIIGGESVLVYSLSKPECVAVLDELNRHRNPRNGQGYDVLKDMRRLELCRNLKGRIVKSDEDDSDEDLRADN
ncbi:hypothetical protein Tco_1004372 [Tanacetum coccineum]|uniref:Uncharacterized protein n=1 Tax=Tanacetum coccineum TaxID=301880 RepID=A0ABQ5FCC3_9ASTR